MTIIFEADNKFDKPLRPERYESDVLVRWRWLWFAVSVLKVSHREYAETEYLWEEM